MPLTKAFYMIPSGAPTAPTLIYGTTAGHFTITNYNPLITYTLTNATRSGNDVTVTSIATDATIKASTPGSPLFSATKTLKTAWNARSLYSIYSGPHEFAGCSEFGHSGYYCGGGSISDASGANWSGPGTVGTFGECGGGCTPPLQCFGYFGFYCYNWTWTDYSGSGYSIIGPTNSTSSIWGKVV